MHKYYLRTTDMPGLIALGVRLGALEPLDGGGVQATHGGTWTFIGPLPDISRVVGTDSDGQPMHDVLRDANGGGAPLQHANLLTPLDLAATATALAQADPSIAAALAQVPRYFVAGEDGKARQPKNPVLVFWRPSIPAVTLPTQKESIDGV